MQLKRNKIWGLNYKKLTIDAIVKRPFVLEFLII